jgi:hypothetical protein
MWLVTELLKNYLLILCSISYNFCNIEVKKKINVFYLWSSPKVFLFYKVRRRNDTW